MSDTTLITNTVCEDAELSGNARRAGLDRPPTQHAHQVHKAPLTSLFECGWVSHGLDLVAEAGPTVEEIMTWLHENYDDVTRHDRHTVTASAQDDWHFSEDGAYAEPCPSRICVTLIFACDVRTDAGLRTAASPQGLEQ